MRRPKSTLGPRHQNLNAGGFFIEQNDSWMEEVSTPGLDGGFHVVLVRVGDSVVYLIIRFSG